MFWKSNPRAKRPSEPALVKLLSAFFFFLRNRKPYLDNDNWNINPRDLGLLPNVSPWKPVVQKAQDKAFHIMRKPEPMLCWAWVHGSDCQHSASLILPCPWLLSFIMIRVPGPEGAFCPLLCREPHWRNLSFSSSFQTETSMPLGWVLLMLPEPVRRLTVGHGLDGPSFS